MAKIGIVCDDYKVEMFTNELNMAGLKFDIQKFSLNTSIFAVESEQDIVRPIFEKVHKFYEDKFKANAQRN